MKCMHCLNFTLRESEKMAKQSFGICTKNDETVYVSPVFERECVKFEQLEKRKVAERVKFLESLNGRQS